MSSEVPPDTNAVAERLWQLGREGASLGVILAAASEAGGRLRAVAALRDAFDLPLHKGVDLVIAYEDVGSGTPDRSLEGLERQHGAQVRAALRPRPRRTVWTKNPADGWSGESED